MRRIINGNVRTSILAGEFYLQRGDGLVQRSVTLEKDNLRPESDSPPPDIYSIAGILDIDGDGIQEVVIKSEYYEGGGFLIFRVMDLNIHEVISSFCGL